MRRNIPAFGLVLLTLASCGTPQEQCIRRNTDEYRVVSNLLAEVEGNLARGYAWAERDVQRLDWDDCSAVVRGKHGKPVLISRPCLRTVTDTERYRVPIDPATEKRKRDNLAARQAVLGKQARAVVAACKQAYPEETATVKK